MTILCFIPAVLKQGYREDDGLFLESDTDEQLLLNIHCELANSLPFRGMDIKGSCLLLTTQRHAGTHA
jgi:hypothetical protein